MTDSDEPMEAPTTRVRDRLLASGPLWIGALSAILLFLFAIQLLGAATEAARPTIARGHDRIVFGSGSALGVSWLVTYAMTSGSVVAALAVSLLASGIASVSGAFMMIVGSRIGGGAIVVIIGGLDYVQEDTTGSMREGTSLGLLTFLITLTIYVPTALLGLLVLATVRPELFAATRGLDLPVGALRFYGPIVDAVTVAIGPWSALALAIALLLVGLWLFDSVLERVETETVRRHVFRHFGRQWTAFGVGVLITALTTSVAFSLGVVVPLYNRGFVRREEITPYVLGANLSTLLDTLVVAFVLDTAAGVTIVLLILGLATAFTLLALFAYDPYVTVIHAGQDKLLSDRRYFVGFLLVMVLVPLALVLLPHG
jgi:sodium-dependent phosphate cotransporter